MSRMDVLMLGQMMLATVALPTLAANPTDPAELAVPEGARAWAIELRSSGGISGRGNGNSGANSDGILVVTEPFGRNPLRMGRLDPLRLRRLDTAVWAATPERWSGKPNGLKPPMPDAVSEGFRMKRREPAGVVLYEFSLSDHSGHRPSDLSALLEKLSQAFESLRNAANQVPTIEGSASRAIKVRSRPSRTGPRSSPIFVLAGVSRSQRMLPPSCSCAFSHAWR